MKKILMMLNCGRAAFAAVLCCAMTMAVLTACSDEVQFARWENDNRWAIGFQPLDEDDLNYLEPVNK